MTARVIPFPGAIHDSLDATDPIRHEGLDGPAYSRFHAALAKTVWEAVASGVGSLKAKTLSVGVAPS